MLILRRCQADGIDSGRRMCNSSFRRTTPMNILVFVTIPVQAQFYRNAILAKHPR
jgi:hypothetical protein